MTLEDLYEAFGGSYRDTAAKFGDVELLKRFVRKFATDSSFEQLKQALQNGETETAFRACHTLKSSCQNLGFTGISMICVEMNELLRRSLLDDARSKLPELEKRYKELMDAISKL